MQRQRGITITGGSVDKKFKYVETILRRFSRRLHKTVIGAIPPIPLFFHTEAPDEDGTIFRWMSPVQGEVTTVALYIGEFIAADRGPAEFEVQVIGVEGSRSTTFSTKRHLNVDVANIPLRVGDRIMLSTDSADNIRDVWVAVLIEVGLKGTKREVFLIEEFEKIIGNEVMEDMKDAEEQI